MKNRTLQMLVIIFVALLLVGCVNLDKKNADGSPAWTTEVPHAPGVYYSVGEARLSSVQTSSIRAEAGARDAIARWASTNVNGAVSTYTEEGGEALRDSQVLEMLEYLSVQTVSISLRGVEKEAQWIAEDGTVWVLMSYPVKNLKEAYRLQAEALERKLEEKKIDALSSKAMVEFFDSYIDSLETNR